MDAQSVLRAQIVVALDDLRTAEDVLSNKAVPQPLRDAAVERLEEAFRKQRQDLESIERDLITGSPPKECWGRLKSTRTETQETLRDSLALLGGLLVRQSRLDDGYSAVASALIGELAQVTPLGIAWPSVTVAVTDAFSPLVGTIQTRYPEFSIWALPIIGHEAGHVVLQEVKALTPNAREYKFPLVEVASAQAAAYGGGGLGDLTVRELFADFFGVWTLGAAYACSAILLRFSPRQADQVVARHPPALLRACLILRTLERVDPDYDDVIRLLGDLWRDLLAPVGLEPLGGDDAASIGLLLKEFTPLANQHLWKARYAGRQDVQELVGPLAGGVPGVPQDVSAYGIRDVMNAAWVARLRDWNHPDRVALVERSAMATCHRIVKARQSGAAGT